MRHPRTWTIRTWLAIAGLGILLALGTYTIASVRHGHDERTEACERGNVLRARVNAVDKRTGGSEHPLTIISDCEAITS